MKTICEVCYYVDKDSRKKDCLYCDTCDAWICKADWTNWYRRGLAAILKKTNGIQKAIFRH